MSEKDKLRRAVELLIAYGEAKFGGDWIPGNASLYLGAVDGAELEKLLELVPPKRKRKREKEAA